MNLAYQIIIKSLVFFCLLFLTAFDSISQSAYDREADFDNYGDFGNEYTNYSNYSYEFSEEDKYRMRQERFYKKSFNEEDLYNGGYRVKSNSSEGNYYTFGGVGSGNIAARAKSWLNDKNVIPFTTTPQQSSSNEVGLIDGIDKLGEDGKSGVTNINNQDKGGVVNPKDNRQTETVPPPPDEPDIPISSPILSLIMIVVMIGIAVFHLSNGLKVL